jgi:hypothetical protein
MADMYDALVSAGLMTKEQAETARAAAAKSKAGSADKPKKSGTYVSTQTSARVPDDLALASKINTVFKKFYDRDADQTELDALLPELRKQYTSKSGKSKTTVKQIFKDGQLVSTDYLTAEGVDPADWVETKLKEQVLSGNQPVNDLNIPEGPAGDYFVKLKNFAGNNGIRLSDDAATAYANQIVGQAISEDTVFNVIRESAATAFPSLSEKIKNGINLKTLADPYIQSMSDILEVPASSVDLFDPHIRSALSYTMKDGAVGTKSIYDFERELRKDSRWQYTEKARKEVAGATMQVLRDFGLQG